jgi:hypothetical protein
MSDMKSEPLYRSGILHDGESRHHATWEMPRVPRLNHMLPEPSQQALYRRQRAHAGLREVGRGLTGLWQAFRRT